jgi:hypothetical protein
MAELNTRYTPPNKQSDGNQWITWYEQIEKAFGKKDASQAFAARWKVTGALNGPANTSDFRGRMKELGIVIDADGILGSALDDVKGFGSSIGGFFKLGGTVMMVVWVIVILVTLAMIWKLAKPEAVGTIIKYAK